MNLRKFYSHFPKLVLFVLLPILLSACETLNWFGDDEDDKIVNFLAFHARSGSARTDAMKLVVKGYVGEKEVDIELQKIPLITSARFKKIEAVEGREGGYDLLVHLDPHAKIRWQADSNEYHGQAVVIMLDDKPLTWWRVEPMSEMRDTILVRCGIEKELAEKIADASENNYKKINGRGWLDL